MKDAYERLAPFIQDYIYKNNWQEMREIQVGACEKILDSDDNVLLASATASGKTEAAFLPALTDLFNNPADSVGILYISPLKALINDQFKRLDGLLRDSGIPVCKWHGDVSSAAKDRLLQNPCGIVQITPESLEAMLMRGRKEVLRLFCDLRYIIIDEMHYFMEDDRGIQLLCILERMQRIIDKIPRRIGLSATLGDYSQAMEWLCSGSGRGCSLPGQGTSKRKIRLLVETPDSENHIPLLYQLTRGKKAIIFANSKQKVEQTIADIKKIADTGDTYLVHHGSLSASLREDVESRMKASDSAITTGATLTLELGIDLGSLERIVQLEAPSTASSFVQRLGRTGRRGSPAEMCFVFEKSADKVKGFKDINWSFLKTIAIIELYLKQGWIEPVEQKKLPFSLLYHQTMSILFSLTEASPAYLAQSVLTLSPFRHITQDTYKQLLNHLISIGHLTLTENNSLIIGTEAEGLVNSYDFFSTFSVQSSFSVKCGNEVIGTINKSSGVGDFISLGGRSLQVTEVDYEDMTIYVKAGDGKSVSGWQGSFYSSVHTLVMQKIKEILDSDEEYQYLSKDSLELLKVSRDISKRLKLTTQSIVRLDIDKLALFPWVGTKAFEALRLFLISEGLSPIENNKIHLPLYLEFEAVFSAKIKEALDKFSIIDNLSFDNLPETDIMKVGGKFDEYIEPQLLLKQYLSDCVDLEDMQAHIKKGE